jgi:hypothetical protein
VMWREFVLDALHIGRSNLESYHNDYTLLCPYLVRRGRYFHGLRFRLTSVKER